MKANTGAQRHVFDGLHVDWNQLRTWREKTLTRERVAEIATVRIDGNGIGIRCLVGCEGG